MWVPVFIEPKIKLYTYLVSILHTSHDSHDDHNTKLSSSFSLLIIDACIAFLSFFLVTHTIVNN